MKYYLNSANITINFICQHKQQPDCNTTQHNTVKYVEQDREAQKCSYFGPLLHTVDQLRILLYAKTKCDENVMLGRLGKLCYNDILSIASKYDITQSHPSSPSCATSPTHSFTLGLNPSFSANPPYRSLSFFFFRIHYMDFPYCLLLLLSISVFFTFFSVFTLFQLSVPCGRLSCMTYVRFRAHVKIASRIVSNFWSRKLFSPCNFMCIRYNQCWCYCTIILS